MGVYDHRCVDNAMAKEVKTITLHTAHHTLYDGV